MRAGTQPLSLKGRALRYLAAREHSRSELERKLRPHEETPGDIARVLDDLQAKDFISEARVVASVLNRRAARLGGARIRQELQSKGIAPDAIGSAVAQLRSTETARAHALWERRFGAPPADLAERGRQVRFLVSRGFAPDVVRRIVQGGGADED